MLEPYEKTIQECEAKGLSCEVLFKSHATNTFLIHAYSTDTSRYIIWNKGTIQTYLSLEHAYIALLKGQNHEVFLLERKGDVALYAVRYQMNMTDYLIWDRGTFIDTYSLKNACDLFYKESGQTI